MNISLCTLAALTSTAVKSTVTVLGISDRAIQYPTRGNTFCFQEESHFHNNVKQLKKKQKNRTFSSLTKGDKTSKSDAFRNLFPNMKQSIFQKLLRTHLILGSS